jgi:hypothetical protein
MESNGVPARARPCFDAPAWAVCTFFPVPAMPPFRRWLLVAGLLCWALAIVHAIFGFDTVFLAVRSQASPSEAAHHDFVFWETWTHMLWICFGMISSAIGGLAIGWALARPGNGDRARQGKIRNIVVGRRVH